MYAGFNARDIDAVLGQLATDVSWPNAWEDGRLHGREEVRNYWLRQWSTIDSTIEPVGFTTLPDGSVAVEANQVVHVLDGGLLDHSRVIHVYTFRDGLIARMDVEEPPAD